MAVVSAAARDLAMVVGRVQISSATPSPVAELEDARSSEGRAHTGMRVRPPPGALWRVNQPGCWASLLTSERFHGVKIVSSALRRE